MVPSAALLVNTVDILQVLLPAAGGGFSAPTAVPISALEPLNPDPAAAQLWAECDLAPAAPKPPEILSMCFAGEKFWHAAPAVLSTGLPTSMAVQCKLCRFFVSALEAGRPQQCSASKCGV